MIRSPHERVVVRLDITDLSHGLYGACWNVDLVDGRRWYVWEIDLRPVTLTAREEEAWLLRLLTR